MCCLAAFRLASSMKTSISVFTKNFSKNPNRSFHMAFTYLHTSKLNTTLTCSVFRKWFELNVSFMILKIFTYRESLFVLPFGPITVSVSHLKFRQQVHFSVTSFFVVWGKGQLLTVFCQLRFSLLCSFFFGAQCYCCCLYDVE